MKKKLSILVFAISLFIAFGFTVEAEAPVPANYVHETVILEEHIPLMIEVFGRGYEVQIEDENGDLIPNPQTKANYARDELTRKIDGMIADEIKRHEQKKVKVNPPKITG